jgi:hypothetical protein
MEGRGESKKESINAAEYKERKKRGVLIGLRMM